MLEFCSSFIKNQCYFGCYPNENQFKELLENDFTYFIDLTTPRERNRLAFDYSLIIPEYENIVYINFSIIDNNIPHSIKSFVNLIDFISTIIEKKKKIYIHCKGGHGRSPMLVASILCRLYLFCPYMALDLTKNYHQSRYDLKEKYKGINCPQLYNQRKFIIDLYQKKKRQSLFKQL